MLEFLKVILLGIVEGITEWLPISSTGHLILVEEFVKLSLRHEFVEMFNVVIQFGAILAVILIYFNKLNPFSSKKSEKQKMMTIQLWIKVIIATLPAMVIGLLFDDFVDEHFMNAYVVAAMLIIYGVLFIIIEKKHEGVTPQATKLSQLTIPMALAIGGFQVLAMIPGTSIRCNNFGGIDQWSIQKCGSRNYIFSCDSGHVWMELSEDAQVWFRIYSTGVLFTIARMRGFICRIYLCN